MNVFVFANLVMAYCWHMPRLPAPGETLAADSLTIEPGGKGLNVAVGLRRLGATVDALVGVGNDAVAGALQALFAAEGLSTRHVVAFAGPSGHGAGMTSTGGSNYICVFPGANALLAETHAQAATAAIAAADLVYGQFETASAALWEGFRLAKAHGVTTALNPSPWQALSAAQLALCDLLIVNEVEAAGLLGELDLAEADLATCLARLRTPVAALMARWPGRLLVVTLGARGALAFPRADAPVMAPAYAVPVVDSIGAGDAFAAGLLHSLVHGMDLPSSLDFANACGGLMVATQGVLAALPSAEAVAHFRQNTPLAGH